MVVVGCQLTAGNSICAITGSWKAKMEGMPGRIASICRAVSRFLG